MGGLERAPHAPRARRAPGNPGRSSIFRQVPSPPDGHPPHRSRPLGGEAPARPAGTGRGRVGGRRLAGPPDVGGTAGRPAGTSRARLSRSPARRRRPRRRHAGRQPPGDRAGGPGRRAPLLRREAAEPHRGRGSRARGSSGGRCRGRAPGRAHLPLPSGHRDSAMPPSARGGSAPSATPRGGSPASSARATTSGVTHADAIHYFDLFGHLLGRKATSAMALQRDYLGRGLDDMSVTIVRYGEVPVVVEASYFAPGTHRECVIVGESGQPGRRLCRGHGRAPRPGVRQAAARGGRRSTGARRASLSGAGSP